VDATNLRVCLNGLLLNGCIFQFWGALNDSEQIYTDTRLKPHGITTQWLTGQHIEVRQVNKTITDKYTNRQVHKGVT